MDFLASLSLAHFPPFNVFFNWGTQTYWPTYLGALIVAIGVYFFRRAGKPAHFRALIRYLFPKKLYFHPSSLLDLKIFLIATVILFLQTGLLFQWSLILSTYVTNIISSVIGEHGAYDVSTFPEKLFLGVVLFLSYELGYWYGHYLLHKVGWLWEFHKVHHSAPVLTPITELRAHPVELVLVNVVSLMVMAIVNGVIFWFYGPESEVYTYFSTGAFIVFFHLTIGHLRHSHINMANSGLWSKLIQSPLHHQIHHSMNPKHFDTNLGFCLAIWDWVFGTLCPPEKGQKIEFGVDDEMRNDYSLKMHILEPFRQAYLVFTGRKKPFAKTLR